MTYEELRQEFLKHSFRKELKDKLGSVCINCETTKNIEYHHIVPLKNGGTNKLTNIVPICEECHYKAHDRSSFNTKNGGRPKLITFEQAESILHRYFRNEIGGIEARELLGLKTKKGAWERLIKEYKSKYDIRDFYNNIDLLNSQVKRIETVKNKKSLK